MMQIRKPQDDEVILDLREFLPGGRKFWWPSEVDGIIAWLKQRLPERVVRIVNEVPSRSHTRHQVLHVTLAGISEEEFRLQARRIIADYKVTHLLVGPGGRRAVD